MHRANSLRVPVRIHVLKPTLTVIAFRAREEMAPKATYTYERLAAVAAQSATEARVKYSSSLIKHLGCHVARQSEAQPRRTSDIPFLWRFRGAGYDETCELKGLCYHMVDRGMRGSVRKRS